MKKHHNSARSYRDVRPKLPQRKALIFRLLKTSRQSLSAREIKSRLNFDDLGQVEPRICELLQSGVLIEDGDIECPTTGKRVRLVKLAKY